VIHRPSNRRGIYKACLRRNRREWPIHLPPDTMICSYVAANLLGVSRKQLERWRRQRIGPPYVDPAMTHERAIWYRACDVLQWRALVLGEFNSPSSRPPDKGQRLDSSLQQLLSFGTLRGFRMVPAWRKKGQRRTDAFRALSARVVELHYRLMLTELQERRGSLITSIALTPHAAVASLSYGPQVGGDRFP